MSNLIFSQKYRNTLKEHFIKDNKNVHGHLKQNIKNNASAYLLTGHDLKHLELQKLKSYQKCFDIGKAVSNMDINASKLLLKIANNLHPNDYILKPTGKHAPCLKLLDSPTIIPISNSLLHLIDTMTNPHSENANNASYQLSRTIYDDIKQTYLFDYELLNHQNPLTTKVSWFKRYFIDWRQIICNQLGFDDLA